MNHFKNKRYWILMPPFLLMTVLLVIFLPIEYRWYSFLPIVVFWMVYYIWNYYSEKDNNMQNDERSLY
ncbi:hypothetical protein [Halobacillus halophilus]|uniref:hypothetical protein n=1 Tax=Halobacillus halophilus TaxID=1570 RepID=UPI001CB9196D|nr:hypothetical protein [Halobacillus halophilus]